MLKVSDTVKNAYSREIADRHLVIRFPEIGAGGLTLKHSQIRSETMQLIESILDQDELEFIGCISSKFKITIDVIPQMLKGQKIEVSTYTDDTETEPVKLFAGIVESDERTGNKKSKQIIAYDALYTLAETDVTEWFLTVAALINTGTKVTIKKFRNALFDYLGIKQVKRTLANDSFVIKKLTDLVESEEEDTEEVEKIYALDLIKAICQINGVFGIMNREGKFDYRRIGIAEEDDGAYPGVDEDGGLYLPFIPGEGDIDVMTDAAFFASYKSVTYEDYGVKGITRVYVRQSEDTKAGYSGGSKKYKYIVQGNRFTMGTTKEEKRNIATSILSKVLGVTYTPFTAQCTGLPYLEVGDPVSFYVYDFEESEKQGKDVYALKSFYVLSRTLKGIQSMTDTLSAQGEEAQRRYVSDLGVREEVSTAKLAEKVDQNTADISDNEKRISDLENAETGLKVESVAVLPENPDSNTIYLIQGTVG